MASEQEVKELEQFIKGAMDNMSDSELKTFEDNLRNHLPIPKNISDLKENEFDYVDNYDDIDPEIEDLLIENDKGEVVWHIKGRDKIREFLDERRKTLNRLKLENKIKSMQLSRKEKSLIKAHMDKLVKDGVITAGELSTSEQDAKEDKKSDKKTD